MEPLVEEQDKKINKNLLCQFFLGSKTNEN